MTAKSEVFKTVRIRESNWWISSSWYWIKTNLSGPTSCQLFKQALNFIVIQITLHHSFMPVDLDSPKTRFTISLQASVHCSPASPSWSRDPNNSWKEVNFSRVKCCKSSLSVSAWFLKTRNIYYFLWILRWSLQLPVLPSRPNKGLSQFHGNIRVCKLLPKNMIISNNLTV